MTTTHAPVSIRINRTAAAVHLSTQADGVIAFPVCGAPGNTPRAYAAFRPFVVSDAPTCKRCLKLTAEEAPAAAETAAEIAAEVVATQPQPTRYLAQRRNRAVGDKWYTIAQGATTAAAADKLFHVMQLAGFRYSELGGEHGHLADLANGHVLSSDEGKQFRVVAG